MNGVEENVAYIAIGAEHALQDLYPFKKGHLDYIFECCEHAAMLEELYKAHETELDGCVFPYDVADPFGYAFGSALLKGNQPDARVIAERIVNEVCKSQRPTTTESSNVP